MHSNRHRYHCLPVQSRLPEAQDVRHVYLTRKKNYKNNCTTPLQALALRLTTNSTLSFSSHTLGLLLASRTHRTRSKSLDLLPPVMSGVRRNEATNLFASLWGDDLQGWNHDQRVMAAEIYELYLATTSITESDLIKRVNSLATKNPEACAAERTSSNSRSILLVS